MVKLGLEGEAAAMARTYLVFGDIEGKLDVLRVECRRCQAKALQCPQVDR